MANLKGKSFDKQVKDIHFRLAAFGESRHGRDDNKTHSSALADKRAEMSQSFASFTEEKGLEGKLNEHMTNENIKEFLDQRTAEHAQSTAENYVRAFSSMIDGLKNANIDILATKVPFEEKMLEIREMPEQTPEINRALEMPEQTLENLYESRFESGVMAEIQLDLGVRISESYEIASNLEKYYNDGSKCIEGLIGKGNHAYEPKPISENLIAKIENIKELPSLRTYQNDLTNEGLKSHDFRYTYAKFQFEKRIEEGFSYKESLKKISQELNHSREEMSRFYLSKA